MYFIYSRFLAFVYRITIQKQLSLSVKCGFVLIALCILLLVYCCCCYYWAT